MYNIFLSLTYNIFLTIFYPIMYNNSSHYVQHFFPSCTKFLFFNFIFPIMYNIFPLMYNNFSRYVQTFQIISSNVSHCALVISHINDLYFILNYSPDIFSLAKKISGLNALVRRDVATGMRARSHGRTGTASARIARPHPIGCASTPGHMAHPHWMRKDN